MAILQRGFDQTNLNGSVGAVTYRRVGGVTIASQKVPMHVEAKKTPRLMFTRMRWVNLVALWKAINQAGWHPSFMRDNRRISDFNMFLRSNMPTARTYITKDVSRAMGAVVAPVILTSPSSLMPIEVEFGSNNIPESDIAVGSLTLGNSTTLKAFSDAIVNENADWAIGDKLTILILRQLLSPVGIPQVVPDYLEVTLQNNDAASTTLLKNVIDISMLNVVDGCLALSGPVNGGCAFVHSRIIDGETRCSGQSLVVNNSYLSSYQGLSAFNAAVESYGGFAVAQLLDPEIPLDFDVNP